VFAACRDGDLLNPTLGRIPPLQRNANPSPQVRAIFTAALENARYQRYLRHKVRPKEFRGRSPVPRATGKDQQVDE
jgi:hypothetical protein